MNQNEFQWINKSKITEEKGVFCIKAPAKTDRFNHLTDNRIVNNAPFYYKEVAGDFVIRAKVSMDYCATYDGVGLMVMLDDTHWITVFQEYIGGDKVIVNSVVTNGGSDDANGPRVEQEHVWLQIAKKDNVFAIHYSIDGKKYNLIRICTIPFSSPLKVGLAVIAPTGDGGNRYFENIYLENLYVRDIYRGC